MFEGIFRLVSIIDDPVLSCDDHGHGPIGDTQLRIDLFQMIFYSVIGELELARQCLVGKPVA